MGKSEVRRKWVLDRLRGRSLKHSFGGSGGEVAESARRARDVFSHICVPTCSAHSCAIVLHITGCCVRLAHKHISCSEAWRMGSFVQLSCPLRCNSAASVVEIH